MRIALLSDSHDDERATRAALDLLKPLAPDLYLHAGDLVSPHMLDLFTGLPFHFVFGNNEYDFPALRSRALALQLKCHEHAASLTLHGKTVALVHGHDARRLQHAAEHHDYVIHGHTHTRKDLRLPTTRIINPGALYRARPRSFALLDLATDTLDFHDLPKP